MPSRAAEAVDLDTVVDLLCDPEIAPERQAASRHAVLRALGPAAEALLRACDQAAGARRRHAALAGDVARLMEGPRLRAVVVGVYDGRVRVALGGAERELARPDGMTLAVGQTVLTDAEGRAVLAAGAPLLGGLTYEFCEILDDDYALVRPLREGPHDDLRQTAILAHGVDRRTLAPGDRVLGWATDLGNLVLVTRRLGPVRPPIADDSGVRRPVAREDIVGLDAVLDETELLFLAPDGDAYAPLLARTAGAWTGACFCGPTGTGKSLVAAYLVGSVRARGGRAIARTGSHYLNKFVGQGDALLRADFEALDAAWAETGVRPLLVIDEIEAIALDRAQVGGLHAGFVDVLDTLLHCLTHTEARVIGISNVATRSIDPALLRDGRLRPILFPSTLGETQTAGLVTRCLDGVPLAGGDAVAAGQAVGDLVFASDGPLARLLQLQLADGRTIPIGAAQLASPAAIADGIVRTTVLRALRDDLRARRAAPAPLPVESFTEATLRYFRERAATITRENVRSVLPDHVPDGQPVVRVERTAVKESEP